MAKPPRNIPASENGAAVQQAYSAYQAARGEHEAFLRDVLDPAYAEAKAAGHSLTPKVMELEDRGNDLCAARHAALRKFVRTPTANVQTVRLKFHLAYDEALKFDDSEGLLKAILADLDRVLG